MQDATFRAKPEQVFEWTKLFLSQNIALPSFEKMSPSLIEKGSPALFELDSNPINLSAAHTLKLSLNPAAIDEPHSFQVSIPLLGTIAAGFPIEVFTDEQILNVHLSYFAQSELGKSGELFALRVSGDSMMNEDILNQDIVVLRKVSYPRSGDVVAALLNGEATLKTLVRWKNQLELHPANPQFPVIAVNPDDRFEIQGVVVGIMRLCEGAPSTGSKSGRVSLSGPTFSPAA